MKMEVCSFSKKYQSKTVTSVIFNYDLFFCLIHAMMLSFFWDSFHVLLMLETQCSFLLVFFFLVVLFFTLVWFGIFLGLCCFLFVLSFLWGLYISICLKYISTNCVFCIKLKKLVKSNGNKFHIIKV